MTISFWPERLPLDSGSVYFLSGIFSCHGSRGQLFQHWFHVWWCIIEREQERRKEKQGLLFTRLAIVADTLWEVAGYSVPGIV